MKKRYMKPVIQVNKIETETLLNLSKGQGYADQGATVLGKERGTRTESDNFDDLW